MLGRGGTSQKRLGKELSVTKINEAPSKAGGLRTLTHISGAILAGITQT